MHQSSSYSFLSTGTALSLIACGQSLTAFYGRYNWIGYFVQATGRGGAVCSVFLAMCSTTLPLPVPWRTTFLSSTKAGLQMLSSGSSQSCTHLGKASICLLECFTFSQTLSPISGKVNQGQTGCVLHDQPNLHCLASGMPCLLPMKTTTACFLSSCHATLATGDLVMLALEAHQMGSAAGDPCLPFAA